MRQPLRQLERSTSNFSIMSNTETLAAYPIPAWEMNKWPEYPEIRYWSDLTYHPARRPFYPFVRPTSSTMNYGIVTRYPGSRTHAVLAQDRRAESLVSDMEWRKTQEYWWNLVDRQRTEDSNGEIHQQRQNGQLIKEAHPDQEAEHYQQDWEASSMESVTRRKQCFCRLATLFNVSQIIIIKSYQAALVVVDWSFPFCLITSWAALVGGTLFTFVHALTWRQWGIDTWESRSYFLCWEKVLRFGSDDDASQNAV